ncbi:MAG: phosphosulfolactate synthase [Methanobrevibacter sp.]|jgi:phosphosulfolactate synthase|nr:phosphosulfolactate synthase [Candidatus Methanovirga aequatorialis]
MNSFDFLLPSRISYDGEDGITMVLDKGLGLLNLIDIMEISGEYLDFLKFGWGTITLHDRDIVKEKIEVANSFDVSPYPGGSLFEIAYLSNKIPEYFDELDRLGFETLEISDGSIAIEHEIKLDLIKKAKRKGFYVLSEVGKKNQIDDNNLELESRINLIKSELSVGSDKVIVEGRESGKSIGIFDKDGNAKDDEIDVILKNINQNDLIWEAPNKNQQVYFVLKLGSNVNLGNININDITSLETIRRGLRGDTISKLFKKIDTI